MTKEEKYFSELGSKLPDATAGKLFGKPCFKINGKAFVCFFQNEMVFKLNDSVHSEALELEGAQLFDPSGKKRPMKEWVQVPFSHKKQWEAFAKSSNSLCGVGNKGSGPPVRDSPWRNSHEGIHPISR